MKRAHERWLLGASLLLLLAHGIALWPLARESGITVDEPVLLAGGKLIVEEGWDEAFTRFQGPLPLYANQLFTGGEDLVSPSQEKIFLGRLGMLAFALLGGAVIALWAREAFGPAAQLLALCLWAPQPLLLGYGALIAVDVAHTSCLLLALYLLWRFARAPRLLRLGAAGAAFGAACATKYLALLYAPLAAICVLWVGVRTHRDAPLALRSVRAATALVAFAAIALLALHAAYGFRPGCAPRETSYYRSELVRTWIDRPVAGHLLGLLPRPFLEGVDFQFEVSRDVHEVYLCGTYAVGHPTYYLAALATKTPEVLFAALLVAAAVAWRRRRSGDIGAHGALALLAGAALFALIYLSLWNRVQVGIRYVLPLIPIACLIAASAARGPLRRGHIVVAVTVLLIGSAETASRWPHLLSYFNRGSGGPANGWRWFRDSNCDWGENTLRGPELLRARHPEGFEVLAGADGPRFGRVAVHAFELGLRDPRDASRAYTWLAPFEPIDHVGAAWLLFDVDRASFERFECAAGDPRRKRDLAVALIGAGARADAAVLLGVLRGELDPEDFGALLHVVHADRDTLAPLERALLDARAWARLGRLDFVQRILEDPLLAAAPEVKREVILALVAQGRRAEAIERLEASADLHGDEVCAVLLFHLYSEVARFADAVRWIEPRLPSLSPALREQVERKLVEQRELIRVTERYRNLR